MSPYLTRLPLPALPFVLAVIGKVKSVQSGDTLTIIYPWSPGRPEATTSEGLHEIHVALSHLVAPAVSRHSTERDAVRSRAWSRSSYTLG